MPISEVQRKFVQHWGEMGSWWNISRSVAQIHALLYIVGRPMHAEEISETLTLARSNVSTSIRELQGWGIIKTVHLIGDRRDHFESLGDVWEMFRRVMEERRRREVEPTLRLLAECARDAEAGGKSEAETKQRIDALADLLRATDAWYEGVRKLPPGMFVKLVKAGGKIGSWLGAGKN